MVINVQRSGSVNLARTNPFCVLIVCGDENTDGSTRITVDTATETIILAEILVAGVWEPADFQFSQSTWVTDGVLGEYVLDETGEQIYDG